MAFKAPPMLQNLGKTAEEELFELIQRKLKMRGSTLQLKPGPDDSRENGEFGDCLISESVYEMEMVTLELKGSTKPLSFSLSDYEKRTSVAKWVIVKGTHGIWCVSMEVARQHLTEMKSGNDKYWVCHPPFSGHVRLDEVLDDVQRTFGEKK